MRYLVSPFQFLRNSENSIWKYLPFAVIISIVPAYFISIGIFHFFPDTERVSQEFGSLLSIFSLAVLAPVIESLMMIPLLILLQKLTKGNWFLSATISALIWAAFHSVFNIVWGFQVVWSFFIFSIIMITWMKKSKIISIAVTSWVHAIQNLIGVLLLYLGT